MATQPANRNSLQPSKASIALIRYLHPASTTLSQTSPDLLSTKNMNIPPIIPQDRSGTSMRMLIHDTQAMFEKYSGCANDLLKGVGEAKRTMLVAQKLFEEDHEKIVGQTVDLGELLRLVLKDGEKQGWRSAYMRTRCLCIACRYSEPMSSRSAEDLRHSCTSPKARRSSSGVSTCFD